MRVPVWRVDAAIARLLASPRYFELMLGLKIGECVRSFLFFCFACELS